MKKLRNLAKEINELLITNPIVAEYLSLKKQIEEDKDLISLYSNIDELRKEVCHNKEKDSEEYYLLLEKYNDDSRVKRFKLLKKEVEELLYQISDILSLK